MKIKIKTAIDGKSPEAALSAFDKNLFSALAPIFPKLEINRFDGSEPGCTVDITLNAGLFKQRWVSKITERETTPQDAWFVDEGVKLPFFLKFWRHKHHIMLDKDQLYIIDDIYFKSHTLLFSLLLYPILYLQFRARKPIYKRWFKSL
ncbi:MAG: SRPBCC family protein [Flavobacteriales bacterium]